MTSLLQKKLKSQKNMAMQNFHLADMVIKVICMPQQIVSRQVQNHLQHCLQLCLSKDESRQTENSMSQRMFSTFITEIQSTQQSHIDYEGVLRVLQEFILIKRDNEQWISNLQIAMPIIGQVISEQLVTSSDEMLSLLLTGQTC